MPPPASSTATQDANGHYTSYRRAHVPGANGDSYRSMVTTPEGNVVFKQTQAGRDYYLYAEKKPGKMVLFAYIGNIDDEASANAATSTPEFIKLHTPYQALSAQFPPPAPMHYSVTRERPTVNWQ